MGCLNQDEDGQRSPVIMGSYGIGVGRLLACLAEEYHDEAGLTLPISVSPYQVHLVSLLKEPQVADQLYTDLQKAGVEVLYDERKESAGVKFTDADLLGIPIRLTLGNRSLQSGKIEAKVRNNLSEVILIDIGEAVSQIVKLIEHLQRNIDEHIIEPELK